MGGKHHSHSNKSKQLDIKNQSSNSSNKQHQQQQSQNRYASNGSSSSSSSSSQHRQQNQATGRAAISEAALAKVASITQQQEQLSKEQQIISEYQGQEVVAATPVRVPVPVPALTSTPAPVPVNGKTVATRAPAAAAAPAPAPTLAVKSQNQENLSLCGCGFLGIYHVGVASCFQEYAPQLSMHKIAGSSVGSLVAVAYICGNLQLAYATTDILRIAIDARARALGPLHPSFDINAVVTEALERGLPDDVHERVSGKLHISLTRLDDLQNVIVSKFESKRDVIEALICSCFIPCWSGFVPPKYKGVAYIDGGFSNNQLILDDKTITVSPFAGEADICPQDDVYNLLTVCLSGTSFSMTPHNLYRLSHALLPPSPEELRDLCERGFSDGIRFLQKMKLISCTRCLEIRSSSLLVETTSTTTTNETVEMQLQEASYATSSTSSISSSSSTSCQGQSATSRRRNSISSFGSYAATQGGGGSTSNSGSSSNGHAGGVRTTTTTKTTTCTRKLTTATVRAAAGEFQPSGSASGIGSNYELTSSKTAGRRDHETADLLEDLLCDYEARQMRKSRKMMKQQPDERTTMEQQQVVLEDCDGCIQRRKNALRDSLPERVRHRIRDACDSVNKSLYNWFYSLRPIKYLSYLAAPYYYPMNISLALLFKYGQQLPYFGVELMAEVKDLLVEIMKRACERSTTSQLMASCHSSSSSSSSSPSCDASLVQEAMDELLACKEQQHHQQHQVATGAGGEQQVANGSSISVKITADCRRHVGGSSGGGGGGGSGSTKKSLALYECCLTVVLFGRRGLLSKC